MLIRPLGIGRCDASVLSRRRSVMSFKLIPNPYRQVETATSASDASRGKCASTLSPGGMFCFVHSSRVHCELEIAVKTSAMRVS